MNPAIRVFAAFVLGLTLGIVVPAVAAVKVIEPVGTLWINALRMPILPLIVALTISGIASIENARQASRLTARALMVFTGMLIAYTLVCTPLAPIALSGLPSDAASSEALRSTITAVATPTAKLTFVDWVLSLVPTNPIKAAADGALLPIVVFSLAYGLALTKATSAVREAQVKLLQGVADVLILLIRGVLVVAPIGVFALSYSLGAKVGSTAVGAVAIYTAAIVITLILAIGVTYLLTWVVGGVSPLRFGSALLPAQAIALSSRSSLAALPALIDGVRAKLHISPSVTSVVLPLGASVFKLNSAVTWSFGAVLVAHLYGVHLDATAWFIYGVGTVLLSFTTPGIPSGGFFVQAPLYTTVGLPVEGIGILIAIDLIPDAFKTALNVTGYGAAAVLVDRWGRNDQVVAAPTSLPLA
ncbi:MAG: dicarboxylate/amino acid:cation symporter [Gemmatimonadaceae bacterium]